jgi:hypothetical protein
MFRPVALLVLLALAAGASPQIVLGQEDDYQDGTLQFWTGGANMQNMADGGPAGAGDRFLHVQSFGGFGGGSRLATFNNSQWTGDFQSAGVTAVSVWMRNLGATALEIRLVLFDFTLGDTRWTSTVSQTLPVGGVWKQMVFSVEEADLTRAQGTQSYADLIVDVDRMMLRHQAGAPAAEGDPIAATVGIDNIVATTNSGPLTVIPTSYVVTEGADPSHNLFALLNSDDVRVQVPSNTSNQSTTMVELFGTVPAITVNRLSFILECHSADSARQKNIEMWNFNTGGWEVVGTATGTTTDSTVIVDVTTNPGRFVHATTREVRARLRFVSPTISRTFSRVIDHFDRAVWEVEG